MGTFRYYTVTWPSRVQLQKLQVKKVNSLGGLPEHIIMSLMLLKEYAQKFNPEK
jgi:hypothetical protein